MIKLRSPKYRILFWWLPLFLITGLVVLYSYSITIFRISYFDTFVVFNLENAPIDVNGNSLELYDSLIVEGTEKQEVKVGSETFSVENKPEESNISIKIVSNDKYCFFTSRITDYYLNEGSPEILQSYNVENNLITLPVNWNKNEYLLPGLYNVDSAQGLFDTKELIGIYPAKCAEIGDQQKLRDLVEIYRYLVPEDQRAVIDRIS